MKRTYVKPVMESEEFVANEYVAACYLITCKEGDYVAVEGSVATFHHDSHGSFIYVSDSEPNFDAFDRNNDGFVWQLLPTYGDAYNGDIGGVSGKHPVTSEKLGDGNGPNASN